MEERIIKRRTDLLFERYKRESFDRFKRYPGLLRHLIFHLDDIDEERLRQLLNEHWDKSEVIDGLITIFDALNIIGSQFGVVKVYHHFLAISKILGAGVQGIVSGAEFTPRDNGQPTIAIKNVRQETPDALLLLEREFLIGVQLNKLMKITPVFGKMYGYVDCSKVIAGGKNQSFCNRQIPATLISQFIPGKTMSFYLQNGMLSAGEFYRIFILLLDGLNKASRYNYTHYDLHTDNVFIRPLTESWNFPVLNNAMISSKYVPTILDYGLSRIDTELGSVFVPYFLEINKQGKVLKGGREFLSNELGNRPEKSPIHDVYKFLYYSLYLVRETPLFNEISWLAGFFDDKISPKSIERLRKETNFVVPEKYRQDKLSEYINWVNFDRRFLTIYNYNPRFHTFGKGPKIDFFSEVGIDLKRYTGMTDVSQWFFLKKLAPDDAEALLPDLKDIYQENLLQLLGDIRKETVGIASTNFNKSAKDLYLLLAGISDALIILSFDIEAFQSASIELNRPTPQLNEAINDLREVLRPAMRAYQNLSSLMDLRDLRPPQI